MGMNRREKDSVLMEQHGVSGPYGEEVPRRNEQFLQLQGKIDIRVHHTWPQRMMSVLRVTVRTCAHRDMRTDNGPYSRKTSRTNVCKSFINAFLRKLSHKHYSYGIS